ncbi:hypothetical protein N9J72_00455 [Candidatus Gracilibacteria bacterium]|nr:hypothetical protein [Candidatus Gracilibacteria bacterium]
MNARPHITPEPATKDPRRNIFDPRDAIDNYDYQSFENMLNYALDSIERNHPEQECDIIKAPENNSYFIEIGDKKFRVSKTGLQIFSFLTRFEGQAISTDNIIKYGLNETEDEERDIGNSNIWVQTMRWNKSTPRELHINNLEGQGYYTQTLRQSMTPICGDLALLDCGKQTQIYKGTNLITSIQLTPSEKAIFSTLISRHFIHRPQGEKELDIYRVTIAGLRKKAKGQSLLKIETIRGIGHRLVINSPDIIAENTKFGTEQALSH